MTGKQRILVTGGTGYLGSHTAVALIQSGFEVVIADNLSNSNASVIEAIEKITGQKPPFFNIDFSDQNAVVQWMKNLKPDGIIHFAAHKSVNESVLNPLKYYKNNIGSMVSVIDGMHQAGSRALVFSSSCSVYGNPAINPVTEETPLLNQQSPYAQTKKVSEDLIIATSGTFPHKSIILRYFNPAGAHESGLIGEDPPDIPTNLVPVLVQTGLGLRKDFEIFGTDYPTPDGTCIRDYIHVTDLSRAHVEALRRTLSEGMEEAVETFNLGTGKGRSVLEVLESFKKVTGILPAHRFSPRREGDVVEIWADPGKAKRILGWETKLGLEEMVRSAWYRAQSAINAAKS